VAETLQVVVALPARVAKDLDGFFVRVAVVEPLLCGFLGHSALFLRMIRTFRVAEVA
jgi:hypothetical protein